MATILYRVTLNATCSQNSKCIGVSHTEIDRLSQDVVKDQVGFMKTRIFCHSCGAPNRFTVELMPKIGPTPAKKA